VVSLLSSTIILAASQQSNENFTKSQIQAIEKIIHEYLVKKNPEVLIDASEALQAKRMKQIETQALAVVRKEPVKFFNSPNSPVEGNKSSNLAIVEFFDYQCPHCRDMKDVMSALLKKNPKLKVIYKMLPIFGESSLQAANAGLSAYKQGKFAQVNDALLSASLPLKQDEILAIMKQAGMNMSQYNLMIRRKTFESELKQNDQLAQAMHLMGTPAFIVANLSTNEYKFIGGAASQEQLQAVLDSIR
jgi:protein-disulfide isomerase